MKLLIIDNTLEPASWGSANLARYAKLASGATVTVRRAPHEDLPENPFAYDRIILSGSKSSCMEDSPWVHKLDALIREWVGVSKPILGVCYGHQSLVRALGGASHLRKSAQAEFGWTRVRVLERIPLWEGLPDEFYTFSSHFEEVSHLPGGMLRTAESENCGIQAFVLEGKPVFGIQFHPEKTLEEGEQILIDKKKLGVPKKLLGLGQSKKLYDPSVGDQIFGNFLRL